MAEEREARRKKRATGEPAQAAATQNLKVGELLRQARIAKGMELEEISSAIHVRVGQLKAIEENHLDALPGMTYAQGFVKSYANHLKLDAADIVARFKAENGTVTPAPQLQGHEPITHSKMPDPFVLAAAGIVFVVAFAAWAIFSGGDDDMREIATNIPPAPVIAEPPPMTAVVPLQTASVDDGSGAPAPITTGPLGTPVTPVQMASSAVAAADAAVAPVVAAQENAAAQTNGTQANGAQAGEAQTMVLTSATPRAKPSAPAQAETADEIAERKAAQDAAINIRANRGRVALKATQSSWVQITQGRDVVFKKVLQPGEVYYVPDGAAYSLVTSNAGGIDVYIDGAKVKTLGGQGDIVRGIKLQPDYLKRNRPRRSNFQE